MICAAANRGELHDRLEVPEEYAGYEVRDPLDQKIGTVEAIFVNDDREPEYVKVKVGFFGLRSVLLPVETIAVDKERRVLTLL